MLKSFVQFSCRVCLQNGGAWLLGLSIATATAQAANQSLESVRDAATRYLARQSGDQTRSQFDASALDPRLRLAQCPTTLEAFAPPTANASAARVTVGVRCSAGAQWTVYVPVAVSSNVKVLILKGAIQRGAHIGADDVTLEERHLPGLASEAVSSLDALAGRHARGSLPSGTALTLDMLASDALIKRGQRVTLIASLGGIEVRAAGEALSEAGSTGRVKVQNLSSMRIVEGVAESADQVRVSP